MDEGSNAARFAWKMCLMLSMLQACLILYGLSSVGVHLCTDDEGIRDGGWGLGVIAMC